MSVEEEIRVLLGSYDAIVDSWDSPKVRRLSYSINDEMQAYLGALRFTISPEHTESLKKNMANKKKIMRFFLVAWKKAVPRRFMKTRPMTKEEQVPTDEKALDEKLNELFGTPAASETQS